MIVMSKSSSLNAGSANTELSVIKLKKLREKVNKGEKILKIC